MQRLRKSGNEAQQNGKGGASLARQIQGPAKCVCIYINNKYSYNHNVCCDNT